MAQRTVAQRHQLAVARKTLTYSDVGARIMGGPTKHEARNIIKELTGSRPCESCDERPAYPGWRVCSICGKAMQRSTS